MVEKHYEITSDKINKDIKIGLFADIHYSKIFKINRFNLIKKNLLINKPDYICIPGDLIDMKNIFDNTYKLNEYLNFFKDISNIAPVYISLGNHDFIRPRNDKLNNYKDWFNKLDNINNVKVLYNSIIEINNIRFIGFNPSLYYYYKNKKEDENILIEEFNKFHSPICILNEKVINNVQSLKNVRLILTGHMHNGIVPYPIDKLIKNNIGLVSPQKTLFPDNARGIKEIVTSGNKVSMVITGGITKIQESAPKILHFGDYLFSPQIDYIKVKSLKK